MKVRFLLLGILLLIGVILNIVLGSVHIPFTDFLSLSESSFYSIVWLSRIPQTLTALLVGISLALSGTLLQTLFRNPLAGPSVMGISSGASLGVGIALILTQYYHFSHPLLLIVSSVLGALGVLFIVLQVSYFIQQSTSLLIVGLMVGYFSSSITSVLQYFSNKDTLQLFSLWGLGDFGSVTWEQMPYFSLFIIVSCLCTFGLMKPLNGLLLGESYASSLGINIKQIRFLILLLTGIMTGVCTAFCGPIAFLGLAVPHLTRLLFTSSNHFILLPAVCLMGANFALVTNLIARLPFSQYTLPINAITSFIGAPIVIFLILKQVRK